MSVRWLDEAVDDVERIVRFIGEFSPKAAVEVRARIVRAALLLDDFPKSGRPGRTRGTRELVVVGLPYIVVHRLRDGVVQIVAVRHAARTWPRSFPR